MNNLSTNKNGGQVKQGSKAAKGKKCVPTITISYQTAKIDPAEAEIRLNRAFDLLFEETIRLDNS